MKEIRIVNERGPLTTVDVELEDIPRIGETIIVRGYKRIVTNVVHSIAVDRYGMDGVGSRITIMTKDESDILDELGVEGNDERRGIFSIWWDGRR